MAFDYISSKQVHDNTPAAISINFDGAKQDSFIDQFMKYTIIAQTIPLSKTLKKLLQNTREVMKTIFKASEVTLMFHDLDIVKILAEEGVNLFELRNQRNQREAFHVHLPNTVRPDEKLFEFRFSTLAEVNDKDVCANQTMVGPVTYNSSDGERKTLMLI